jgi:hypothetical protein
MEFNNAAYKKEVAEERHGKNKTATLRKALLYNRTDFFRHIRGAAFSVGGPHLVVGGLNIILVVGSIAYVIKHCTQIKLNIAAYKKEVVEE